MRLEDTNPKILMIFRNAISGIKSSAEQHKLSLTYRLLAQLHGSLSLRIGERRELCEPGDIIFMPPGEEYYTTFSDGDCEFLNIFFGFDENPAESPSRTGFFVMMGRGAPDPGSVRAAERIAFSDLPEWSGTFVVRGLPDSVEKCRELFRIHKDAGAHGRLRQNAKLSELLCDIAEHVSKPRREPADELALAVVSYIGAHYSEHLTCRSVAERFAYHPNYINRIVRTLTGCSLHDYIVRVKLSHADRLLLETDMSITDIGHFLAFHDASHFTKAYRAYMGIKPSERRRSLLSGIEKN